MKRVLVMLVAGTVLSGVAAAFACMGGPIEAAQAGDQDDAPTAIAALAD